MAHSIALDAQGNAYIAGDTNSPDFSAVGAPQPTQAGKRDAFLVKLNSSGTAFEYRTYLGGSEQDAATAVAVDSSGAAFVAGASESRDFRTTFGVAQPLSSGQVNSFLAKIAPGTPEASIAVVSSASYLPSTGLAPDSMAAAFGKDLAPTTVLADASPLPTTLAGRSVFVKDSTGAEFEAELNAVTPTQINFVVPAAVRSGLAQISVRSLGQVLATGTARIGAVAPALFSANGSGRGVASAVALRVKGDGSQSSELAFSCDQSGCAGNPISLDNPNDQVYLLLFGTGIRRYSSQPKVTIGGTDVPVMAAVAQGMFPGLDQVNVGPLPSSLANRGEAAVQLTVDGQIANTVTVTIR